MLNNFALFKIKKKSLKLVSRKGIKVALEGETIVNLNIID